MEYILKWIWIVVQNFLWEGYVLYYKSKEIFNYQQFTCKPGYVWDHVRSCHRTIFFCKNKTYYFWWQLLRSTISCKIFRRWSFRKVRLGAMRLIFSNNEFLRLGPFWQLWIIFVNDLTLPFLLHDYCAAEVSFR